MLFCTQVSEPIYQNKIVGARARHDEVFQQFCPRLQTAQKRIIGAVYKTWIRLLWSDWIADRIESDWYLRVGLVSFAFGAELLFWEMIQVARKKDRSSHNISLTGLTWFSCCKFCCWWQNILFSIDTSENFLLLFLTAVYQYLFTFASTFVFHEAG